MKSKNSKDPLVSVVMAVYNGDKYLKESIESILNQTYKNIEFIVINDGSLDNTKEILEKYQQKDPRIKVLNNGINKGLIYSLNKGFKEAQGKYIARMDADDISLLKRLEKQVEYMEKNNQVALCSGLIKIFKNKNKFLTKKLKLILPSEQIESSLLFKNYIAHPVVMLRKSELKNLEYKEINKGMEDYGLWLDLIKKNKIVILPEVLLKYRFVNSSITSNFLKKKEEYQKSLENFYSRELKFYFENLTEKDIKIHVEITGATKFDLRFNLEEKEEYLLKLLSLNTKINDEELKKEIIFRMKENLVINGSLKKYKENKFIQKKYSILEYFKLKGLFIIKKNVRKILR